MLDRFLEGEITLKKVKGNKILVAVNSPIRNEIINAVSAARATLGINAEIVVLDTPLILTARIDESHATGDIIGWQELVDQVNNYDFDALAISTAITVDKNVVVEYLENVGINPWGGVEAKASHLICDAINKPTAHAPIDDGQFADYNEISDPRIAAEMVSFCFLHCVLKGLHKAPIIGRGLSVDDIDCLVTPVNCVGRPHIACLKRNIPIIAVKENTTYLKDKMPDEFIIVDNYLEATGLIVAMKMGIAHESVRRPLDYTKIHTKNEKTIREYSFSLLTV